jgi:hypothetical protein
MDTSKKGLRAAPAQYQELVNRLCKLAGMKHTLEVYETDQNKAWQTHHQNGLPVIAYNPKYIDGVKKAGNWAVVALFANELAYHYNMDFWGKYISEFYGIKTVNAERRKRMNVDYFVGRVLRNEGASLGESLEVLALLGKSKSDYVREEREEVLTNGWKAADSTLNNVAGLQGVKKEGPASSLAVMLLGLIFFLMKD